MDQLQYLRNKTMAKRNWTNHYDTQNMGVRKHGTNQSRLDTNYYSNPKTGFDSAFYAKRESAGYITFGKHKGKHISQIPKAYIHWLKQNIDTGKHPGLSKALKQI